MEGTSRLPGSRLAEFARAHPEIECPPPVEGTWHAWIPAGGFAGTEIHARDEGELVAKLTAELGG